MNKKALFSFLMEKIQPKQVSVCGEWLQYIELPDFVYENKNGLEKLKYKIYERLIGTKIKRILKQTTGQLPLSVLEACLADFFKKECAFRKSTKVLIADKSSVDLKALLIPYYSSINYLQLFVENREDYEYLADDMYEETGLAIAFAAPSLEKYHIVVDLKNDFYIPSENLAEGCVYFDGFSDKKKEKRLRRESAGITYLSPMIYLDRALKNKL